MLDMCPRGGALYPIILTRGDQTTTIWFLAHLVVETKILGGRRRKRFRQSINRAPAGSLGGKTYVLILYPVCFFFSLSLVAALVFNKGVG